MPKQKNDLTKKSKTPVFIDEKIKKNSKDAKTLKSKKSRKYSLDELKNIYEEDGEMPNLTELEQRKRNPWVIIIGLLAFFAVLTGAAWTGFFIFKPYSRFEGNGLNISIDGPTEVKAGEAVSYDFKYKNTEKVGLGSLELRIVLPQEFKVVDTSTPPTADPFTWTLGSQNSGDENKITIRGILLGPSDSRTALQSIASYRPTNFNSDFQSITTKQITLSGSVIEGTLNGPPEIAPGEISEYSYKIKNTGQEPLDSAVILLEAPSSFIFDSAEPTPADERGTRWEIARLEPNIEIEIKIRGSFAADAQGQATLRTSVGLILGDDRLIHRRDEIQTNLLASDLSLNLAINGSTGNSTADFGDTLNLTLSYENNGELNLGNTSLSITVAEDPVGLINWQEAEINSRGRRNDGTITWTSRELNSLTTIGANQNGTIDVSLPIISSPPTKAGNDEIRISGAALVQTVNGRSISKQIQTTPIIISLNSDLNFTAEARYFDEDGAALGSGPLPLKDGETTKLRIFWKISNSRHALSNVRVQATLPSRINWTGHSNTANGEIRWNQTSKIVSWVISNVDASSNDITADFEIDVAPNASDVGRFVTLSGETTFEAHDEVTSSTVSRRINYLNSEMSTDAGARGKGVVVE